MLVPDHHSYTSKTALMHPSFSGLFVTCAYFPQTTLPPGVTNPSSLTFTSMIVPFVTTPRLVYACPFGFFFTPKIFYWFIMLLSIKFNKKFNLWNVKIKR